MKKLSSLFFLLFLANSLSAQNLNTLDLKILDSLFKVEMSASNFEAALAVAEIALKKTLTNYGENDSITGARYKNMGTVHHYLGQFEKTKEFWTKSSLAYEKSLGKENITYAGSLVNLGVLYQSMQQEEDAEPLFLSAKKILQKAPEHPYYSYCLNNLGILYYNLEKYTAAEPLFKESMALHEKVLGETHPNYARVINNLASLYDETEQYELAIPLFEKAIEIQLNTVGEYSDDYAHSLNNLANVYHTLGRYDEAEVRHLKVLSIYKKIHTVQHPHYATAIGNVGMFYIDKKDFDQALLYLQQALDLEKKLWGNKHPNYIKALNNLAELFYSKKDDATTLKYLQQSIQANAKIDASLLKIGTIGKEYLDTLKNIEFISKEEILKSLSTLYKTLKASYAENKNPEELSLAYEALKLTMLIYNQVRTAFSSFEDKIFIMSDASKNIGHIINLGIELESLKKQSLSNDLFGYAELNKSVLLADATQTRRAHSLSDLPDSLVLKELEMQQYLDELKKQAIEEPTNPTINQEINQINLEIDVFKKQLETNFPKYYKLKYANITANARDIQKVLNKDVLFLEYFIADSAIYLFVIDKTTVNLIPLKLNETILASKIATLRQSLSDYNLIAKRQGEAYQLYTKTAFWFYENLLAPALSKTPSPSKLGVQDNSLGEKGSAAQSLIIVADGELGHVPFEVFLVEPASQTLTDYNKLHYLVNDYNVSYNYSATLWKENLGSPAKKNNAKMLALAATYAKSDKDSSATRSNRSPHLLNLRDILIELPAAQKEVLALKKSFQGDFLMSDAANERHFKTHAADYGIIHLAMHGVLNETSPILSSLAFTENHDSIDDNFLEAWEIAHLKLNADLVVLSACETGYGKFEQGEGVMSLARSFMYAGVPSLVVSLWQVNDYSTSLIMNSFYQYLADGLPKDEALRQAKLEYLKRADGIAAHPAFWSPFIQLGDNRPIRVETRFIASKTVWAAGIAALLAITGIAIARRKRVNN